MSSTDQQMEKIINFRDVHSSTNSPLLQLGRLYRSARPDSATPADIEALKTQYHIKTILDLRTPTEHVETAKKLQSADIPSSPLVNPDYPLALPGLGYKHVNFNGSAYSNALLSHLTYYQTARLYVLFLLGYRREAIGIVAENVMAKRGLLGLAEDTLVYCTAEVKQIFDVLGDERQCPVLVHCTQGKDRTGLTVFLVLALLGVDSEAIERDYMLTDRDLAPEKADKLAELKAFGLPPDFADCAPGWVEHVSTFIQEKYGGISEYLEHCGVSQDQQTAVKKNFGT